ncbi:hypothetical protein NUU61_005653 [Penicillium alfredii]|uniref:Uncharacterized protein n=1 Tax=Penicillium alfredii TaxID=1506179 RepID=A0A9W9F9T8_9EURO|nr:uncharacterized protein NUU61_005653 [Penicillium alfredii]KAJ5096297.1 hypothetical protein NUU61_005653 [Penicillium alfredii]
MAPVSAPSEHDSDDDVEFEDVPPPGVTQTSGPSSTRPAASHVESWSPSLSLPPQRDHPIPSGSQEETQLRGRLSSGIETITYRQMKSHLGMDAPNTPASQRRYESFQEFADDVEHLVDILWASATATIQVEGFITLAGIVQMSIRSFIFEPHPMLNILHKFDEIFAGLCTATHPLTGLPLPALPSNRPLVTETQKVRIRSLAETTRSEVFSYLSNPDERTAPDVDLDDFDSGDLETPWMLEATRIYDKTLMLLGDQGETDAL